MCCIHGVADIRDLLSLVSILNGQYLIFFIIVLTTLPGEEKCFMPSMDLTKSILVFPHIDVVTSTGLYRVSRHFTVGISLPLKELKVVVVD